MAIAVPKVLPKVSRKGSLARREAIAFYLFILPWILGFLAFTVIPILASGYLSFTEYDIANPPVWVGFGNYQHLFGDPIFRKSIRVTLTYAVMALPLGLFFSIALALLLNLKLPALSLWRTLYYLPAVISGVAVALLWQLIFQPTFGLLNVFLYTTFHIIGPQWQFDEAWVIPMFVIISIWGVGGGMLVYLGGLQGIPSQLYEAAEIDGAGSWRRLFNITLPMLTPVILFNLILGIIGVLTYFTNAYVITSGGPDYASEFFLLLLYQNAFEFLHMGLASAMAWLFFLFALALTIIVMRTSNRWVYYEGEVK